MKIAFPTNWTDLDSEIFPHFWRCKNYLIYNSESKEFEVIKNTSEHMWGTWLPPQVIKDFWANIIIVSDLWSNALKLFNELEIEVYCKAEWKIEGILDDFNKWILKKANLDLTCKEH